ncbi:FkbM family methyltransferase [Ruficoccus amylovorans]|uniref:FkbM family methyltransferase n=1 Tax=Ruficoccus amylovorans TaxID=1804625 RepID=A0A842HHF3_9BACT|nr:FkbM family methyltransferase [Ruficoccus amylovorans]MBC2595046.1 FkbM family methyltransferase [Ruficoccus amylovorans]
MKPPCPPGPATPAKTLTLTLPGDVKICVRADIRQMTTFVLLEQEDWFEDEMAFVRRLAKPGMRMLDVGANHGVYSLTVARQLNGEGRIWSVEPASEPGSLLQQSIGENGFGMVMSWVRAALSDHEGEATLTLGDSSELNSLQGNGGGRRTETVALRTLDSLLPDIGDQPIDFMKLDAEGEELRVLAGGREFFARHSPLVMFELKHSSTINWGLIDAFKALGMTVYQYLPGLRALVPVEDAQTLDGYVLNLFAARPERAAQLAREGLLYEGDTVVGPQEGDRPDWSEQLLGKPFGRPMAAAWARTLKDRAALALHAETLALALDFENPQFDLGYRLEAGRRAKLAFEKKFAAGQGTVTMVATYSRVLRSLGYRTGAVNVMGGSLERLMQVMPADLTQPFLPPDPASDVAVPAGSLESWFRTQCLQFLERIRTLSSYFTPDTGLMEKVLREESRGVEMERRFALRSALSGRSIHVRPDSRLLKVGPEHRNAASWEWLAKTWKSSALRKTSAGTPRPPAAPRSFESLAELLPAPLETVRVVDVGACSHGEGTEPYAPLVKRSLAVVTGFEPNPEECAKVQALHGDGHRFLPYFIGAGGPATYHETHWVQTGSLYRPDAEIIDAFGLRELVQLKQTHPVTTHALDDLPDLGEIDLLKLDIQGGELDALRHGVRVLSDVLVIQVEVEFIPLYEGQPLFADIDTFLRGQGFLLHTFVDIAPGYFAPLARPQVPKGITQALWSDALYVRDFRRLRGLPPTRLKKLALILHDVYRAYNLCHKVLQILDQREPLPGSASAYRAWLEANEGH